MNQTEMQLLRDRGMDDGHEEPRVRQTIDFKMVTFSLGGKDYGIDIMRVKEIAKFSQFTYVPNTAPYVRGVYNLRGDIISIIDLRLMFNLPVEEREEGVPENGLILRLESNLIGVVVDRIDKVVGISSTQVQPPHPIFGDINVKYINGVAEHEGRLYIILDVDRIFRRDEEPDRGSTAVERPPMNADVPRRSPAAPDSRGVSLPPNATTPGAPVEDSAEKKQAELAVQRDFVAQGLETFAGFSVTGVNVDWFGRRMETWRASRESAGKDIQLRDEADAAEFLSGFASRYTDRFWRDDYITEFVSLLPEFDTPIINVWNPGCGSGYESYSLALLLLEQYPGSQVKVWAGDKDLLRISSAPDLVFEPGDVPARWQDHVVSGRTGFTFETRVKDAILFEFSDVLHTGGMPRMDMVVARDLLSYHREDEQRRILDTFEETLKPGGVLLLGDNERVFDGASWHEIVGDSLTVYRRQ
jgi:purine-binding chemotaxis protein CheW